MECPSCERDNADDAQYCSGCGLSLQLVCSDCGRGSPSSASFCSGCGSRLGAEAGSTVMSSQEPSKPAEDLPAFFKAGRYVVKAFLGEGARKKVYLVQDTVLDCDVAFALIRTEGLDDVGRQRILREAQTMGRLSDHPNIVPLYDLGDEAGQPYMVSPVLRGGDVEKRIEEAPEGKLPIDEAIGIASAICRGLVFAHSNGIIHRDLKPANVYLAALEAIEAAAESQFPAVDSAQPEALDSLTSTAFVGRQKEMGELKAALEDTLSGHGRLVMISGDPGIGKTRTSTELATYASLRGAQVLWGRCHEASGAPDYWPWVQAVRSYVRDRDAQQLSSEMGAGAAYISDILPEVRARIPNVGESQIVEPDQARFRLFDSIASFLRSATGSQPLMIVLDDLHWADQPSLMLLEFDALGVPGPRAWRDAAPDNVNPPRRRGLPVPSSIGDPGQPCRTGHGSADISQGHVSEGCGGVHKS